MDKQIEKMAKVLCINDNFICETCPSKNECFNYKHAKQLYNAGYGDLRAFAEKLKNKAIRQQEFVGELAIGDIEYVKVKDIDKTLNEFLGE